MGNDAVIRLYEAWLAPDHAARLAILHGLGPPGPIALRSRYRHLCDPLTRSGPLQVGLAIDEWRRVLDLETEGDVALQRGDLDGAATAFARLAGFETSPDHRVVTIHALVGKADIARAADDADAAINAYERALALSVSDGYRFGQLRALVALGYLSMSYASVATAIEQFTAAAALADGLRDPLYRANANLGLAECMERTGDLPGAIEAALSTYAAFEKIKSSVGQANAAHRIGALMHRDRRRAEARTWLEKADSLYLEVGDPVGRANVLSGLGDLHLDAREFKMAEHHYVQALRLAESAGLPRARAHALQDLARVERGRGNWAESERRFEQALVAYRELDEIVAVWHALDKIAEAQEHLGMPEAVSRTRLEAVLSIEAFRSAHRDERSQREYVDRFALAYSRSINAAIDVNDVNAFVVVADGLAGRRLAGLVESSVRTAPSDDLTLAQQMLAHADQRLLQHRRRPGGSTREQRIRLLGALSVRHGLVEQAEVALDDQLAAFYLPLEHDVRPILRALPAAAHVIQLVIDPIDPATLCWLWRPIGQPPRLGRTALGGDALSLLAVLADDDARIHLRLTDLEPLGALLPPGSAAAMAAAPGSAVVIVPVGDLWVVPWSAVPLVDGAVLGEIVRYAVCPSLTVQRQLAGRKVRSAVQSGIDVDVWRSPLVGSHQLAGLAETGAFRIRRIATAAAARERLRRGGEMMVVIGHGRPTPGMARYLELDDGDWLVLADLLDAATPRRLALLACGIGAIGPGRPSDPVSLATLALAARSDEVLATLGELGDSDPAVRYTERILLEMGEHDLPEAVHIATRWLLGHDDIRSEPIFHWAPLIPIGTI